MASSNICECPNPPGGIVECDPKDVAACYVDEHRVPHTACIPLNRQQQQLLNFADDTGRRVLVSGFLAGVFGVSESVLLKARWVSQSLDGGTFINIQLATGDINVRLPAIGVAGKVEGISVEEFRKDQQVISHS